MSLWTFNDVLRAVGGNAAGRPAAATAPISGISIDSRTVSPGDLYVAIVGDRLDGHAFVDAAFEAGAAAALVRAGTESAAGPLITVPEDDPLRGLERLGIAARGRMTGQIVGVTGSVGKTGTKEMLRQVLSPFGATHAAVKSFNNHWGVPLTLARTPATAAFGVYEIGMNHAGEITPLTGFVRPHVAIVTTVEPVHIEFFDSVEGIADAKGEIFSGLVDGGTAVINADNPHAARLRGHAERSPAGRILTFGEAASADVRLTAFDGGPDGSRFSADVCGVPVDVSIGAPGRHIVQNALAVLAAVHALGIDPLDAAPAFASVRPPDGRGARTPLTVAGVGRVLLVDESYNANPASMRAAFDTLAKLPRGDAPRRIAVIGDMLELGAAAKALHVGLVDALIAADINVVFACGPQMSALFDVLPEAMRGGYAPTSEELAPMVVNALRDGDAIVVKGSLGSRMAKVITAVRAVGTEEGGPEDATQHLS